MTAQTSTRLRTRSRSGPSGPDSPWSMVCCTAMGTTTRPAVAISASRKVSGRPRRNSGIIAGRGAAGTRRSPAGRRPAARSRSRHASRARELARPDLGLLVGAHQRGVGGHLVEQLLVGAAGGDAAVLEPHHPLGGGGGRPPGGGEPPP